MKFYNVATAQARPLQYKNCYHWVLVAELKDGTVYYFNTSHIIKSTREQVLKLHELVTRQKPVKVKAVDKKLLYGIQFGMLMYAIENNMDTTRVESHTGEWQKLFGEWKEKYPFNKINHEAVH